MLTWMRFIGLALLGWGAWLSFPGTASEGDELPGLTALVLDVSASATRLRTGWEVRARRDVLAVATEAAERGDDFLLVTYAADVRRVLGPAPADEALNSLRGSGGLSGQGIRLALEPARALESRLASALDVARDSLMEPNRVACRLVLRTDGSFTGVDPAPTLAALVAQGVALKVLPLEAPDQPDLALLRFEVPSRIEVGARASARLELAAQGFESANSVAQLELTIESAGEVTHRTLELPTLRDGSFSSTHFVDLGIVRPGTTSVRAQVQLVKTSRGYVGDRIPENDSVTTWFQSRDALTCVVVTHDEGNAKRWFGRVPEGLEVRYCKPADLGAHLGLADLCVTCDVSLAELDGALLASFVVRGGGLLATGGWKLLRGWESENARVTAELLPLKPAESQRAPRDVQFIVDGSGSMAGNPFEAVREALIDLVPAAPLVDRVSLRFFTGALQPLLVLSAGGNDGELSREQRVRELLSDTVPGGQTHLVSSLEQLAKERQAATDEALILLLSDGHESNGFNSVERAATLASTFVSTRTVVEVIAVGKDPDLDLLRAFLPPGKELTRVLGFEGLDEVFQRSVNRERVELGPVPLVVNSIAEEALGRGVAQALSRVSLPSLARTLVTEEREGASVLVRSSKGHPVLALRRVGLGVSALLATGPGADWSGELRLGEHLESLLRRLGRAANPERSPRIRLGEQLVLENADVEWPALLTARVARRTGQEEVWLGDCSLGLAESSPGEDPRAMRVAARPAFLDGLAPGMRIVVDLIDERESRLARVACAVPSLPEFGGAQNLSDMPEPSTAPALGAAGVSRVSHPAAPFLIGAGLLLLTLAGLAQSGLFGRFRESKYAAR